MAMCFVMLQLSWCAMKLLKREISAKNGDGFVTVVAEEPEDMWHIYNLIAHGDHLRASTYRKARLTGRRSRHHPPLRARSRVQPPVTRALPAQVVREGTTGSTVASRVRTTLTLEVRLADLVDAARRGPGSPAGWAAAD